MAESIEQRDPGAPIARDAIDPDLIKLKRSRTKVGVITAAGVVFLCTYFLIRLWPDLKFGQNDTPARAEVSAVLAGKVGHEAYIELQAEPLMSHAIRTVKAKGDMGLRVVPTRGTNERLWLVLGGDGWDRPVTANCKGAAGQRCYTGRLRALADLPFSDAVRAYAASHPRPLFARPADVRTGFPASTVKTITGEDVKIADSDRVALDVIDANASTIIATFTPGTEEHAPLLDATAWQAELAKLGITAIPKPELEKNDALLGQARFTIAMSVPAATEKLEAAKLWAARVEPVTRHYRTTWGALRASGPAGFTVDDKTSIADAQLDLVGLYVSRAIPDGAYALMTNERPADYWHVLPITVIVVGIGLLFAWALIRAVRRDLLPTRA